MNNLVRTPKRVYLTLTLNVFLVTLNEVKSLLPMQVEVRHRSRGHEPQRREILRYRSE